MIGASEIQVYPLLECSPPKLPGGGPDRFLARAVQGDFCGAAE